jgi:hypothetical protein
MAMGARTGVMGVLVAALSLAACQQSGEMAILDVQPRVGHTQGDQPVRIIGKNFRQDIGYTIYFGNKKAQSLTLRDPETIEVSTPNAMPAGPVDIMIRADNGNAFKITQAFRFEQAQKGPGAMGEPGAAKEDKGNLAY